MSMDYNVNAITNQPLTEEIIRQIVVNSKAIGFTKVEFSPDLNTNYKVELNNALAHAMWLEYQEKNCTGLDLWFWDNEKEISASFVLSINKKNNNFVEMGLYQPGGSNRVGRSYGLGIDFHWYVKKLLQLSNPLPIIRLRTEVNFEGMYENQRIDFWVVKNSGSYLNDNWRETEKIVFTNNAPDYDRTFFLKLQINALNHGHILAIPEFTDEFLMQEKILSGRASWGEFSLKLSKYNDISVIIDNQNAYENLRDPLQLLVELTEGIDMLNFYADNGKNPNLSR